MHQRIALIGGPRVNPDQALPGQLRRDTPCVPFVDQIGEHSSDQLRTAWPVGHSEEVEKFAVSTGKPIDTLGQHPRQWPCGDSVRWSRISGRPLLTDRRGDDPGIQRVAARTLVHQVGEPGRRTAPVDLSPGVCRDDGGFDRLELGQR
jgi:hypothetical protein